MPDDKVQILLAELLQDVGAEPECIHIMNYNTLMYAGYEDICDVSCINCGRSGSFRLPDAAEVDWS